MATLRMVLNAILAVHLPLSWAQQFTGTHMFTNYTGLSILCQGALRTNVTCSPYLGIVSESDGVMTTDQVTSVCLDSCYASLQAARAIIAAACTLSTDVIVVQNVAYPATFIVDKYLYTYQLSCRKDSTTGEYCDPLIMSWSNRTLTTDQQCSDCWLGGLALELASPFGYDDVLASNYASLTSSCNATAYTYTTPTQYAINATATTIPTSVTATLTPTCTGSYAVGADDDCNSVALALNVSTYSLLYMNNLDLYCQNWASVLNSTLCIPPQCETYIWQMQDSCDSVVSGLANVTVPQFLAWNPNFNSLCQNAVNYIGYVVCIGPPGGYLNHTIDTPGNSTSPDPSIITTAAPVPTNALNGSTAECGKWYTVVEGDTCSLVSVANSISLTDFYFLNPEIDANCTNLELGEAYCIAAVGDISSYSGYPVTTPWITVPVASFPAVDTSIPTATSDPGFIYTPRYLPTAPGTTTGCTSYVNYDNTTYNLNSCRFIAYAYDVTTDDFLAWNPSLDTNLTTCSLQSGYSYCALLNSSYIIGSGSYSSSDNNPMCLPINATESTTVSNCNCFTQVYGYMNGDYECDDIESDCGITATELTAWNPWLAGDCDTALYANITDNDSRAVCIGVGSETSTTTTTAATTGSATTTTSAAPTQTGVIAGCQEFFTVESGDNCSTIEAEFGVSLTELYEWNPSIGPTCTNLWLGYAYCVKGPATTKTTSITSVGPTQTGTAANCDKYHMVVDGDSCSAIESEYDITFAQLYTWNPAIGSDCNALVIGYAVCVGVSS